MPTCVSARGRPDLRRPSAPGGFRYLASNESDSGTSSVIVLPAMAAIVRSVVEDACPARIQVCGLPSRIRSSICMNFTQASVTGRRMAIVSPAAKPLASATVNDGRAGRDVGVGDGALRRPCRLCRLVGRRRRCRRADARWPACGWPVSLRVVRFLPGSLPLPRSTTPLAAIEIGLGHGKRPAPAAPRRGSRPSSGSADDLVDRRLDRGRVVLAAGGLRRVRLTGTVGQRHAAAHVAGVGEVHDPVAGRRRLVDELAVRRRDKPTRSSVSRPWSRHRPGG